MKTKYPSTDNTLTQSTDANIRDWLTMMNLDWRAGIGSKNDFLMAHNTELWSLIDRDQFEEADKLKMGMTNALIYLSQLYENATEIPEFENESFIDYESRVLEYLVLENEKIFLSMGNAR